MQRAIDLTTTARRLGRPRAVTLTTNAAPSSLLDTDATNGLQMTIDRCSTAWTESGVSPAFTYSCSGTTTSVLASRAVIGLNRPVESVVARGGVTDHLRVTLTLPSTAPNTMQGLAPRSPTRSSARSGPGPTSSRRRAELRACTHGPGAAGAVLRAELVLGLPSASWRADDARQPLRPAGAAPFCVALAGAAMLAGADTRRLRRTPPSATRCSPSRSRLRVPRPRPPRRRLPDADRPLGQHAPDLRAGRRRRRHAREPRSLRVGDVIAYQVPVGDRQVETHRVVRILRREPRPVVVTKGDANDAADPWTAELHGAGLALPLRRPAGGPGHPGRARRPPSGRRSLFAFPALLALLGLARIWGRRAPRKAPRCAAPLGSPPQPARSRSRSRSSASPRRRSRPRRARGRSRSRPPRSSADRPHLDGGLQNKAPTSGTTSSSTGPRRPRRSSPATTILRGNGLCGTRTLVATVSGLGTTTWTDTDVAAAAPTTMPCAPPTAAGRAPTRARVAQTTPSSNNCNSRR